MILFALVQFPFSLRSKGILKITSTHEKRSWVILEVADPVSLPACLHGKLRRAGAQRDAQNGNCSLTALAGRFGGCGRDGDSILLCCSSPSRFARRGFSKSQLLAKRARLSHSHI
jgi:hypothetical protein